MILRKTILIEEEEFWNICRFKMWSYSPAIESSEQFSAIAIDLRDSRETFTAAKILWMYKTLLQIIIIRWRFTVCDHNYLLNFRFFFLNFGFLVILGKNITIDDLPYRLCLE